MPSNFGREKKQRKSPWKRGERQPKRNARLTDEQEAEHEARIRAHQVRVENELLDKLVEG